MRDGRDEHCQNKLSVPTTQYTPINSNQSEEGEGDRECATYPKPL